MRARNARLNSNGGWCVKTLENYVVKEKYNFLSEFLCKYKCKWICCTHETTTSNNLEWKIMKYPTSDLIFFNIHKSVMANAHKEIHSHKVTGAEL